MGNNEKFKQKRCGQICIFKNKFISSNPIFIKAKDLSRHFSKEDTHMANKHMERCLLIFSEMFIKSHNEIPPYTHTQFSSVQSLRHVQLFATPWTAAYQASLSITSSWSLLKLMPIKLVMSSNHLILCRPLLLLPSICPSIRVFSNESVLHIRWPKYWSFSFNISPSNEYSGLISIRIDWFDLLAVQGALKSLLQHHSSKASILWCSAFFMEKAMATHSSTLAWKIPWTEEPGTLQSMGSLSQTRLSDFTFT